jgi:hypothetical protein
MPPKRYVPINPAPAKFHYEPGWLGGWIICEGQGDRRHVLAVTQEKTYAAAIVNCLNICVALFAHLPIKLGGTHSDSVN